MSLEHCPARSGDTPKTSSLDTFLTEAETAKLLKLSQRTLQRWRLEGSQGLPFRRFGGLIRYALSDIERWAAEQTRMSTSEAGHGAA
jgi:phage terminase Nu1 subunit (DNA packaging protein)